MSSKKISFVILSVLIVFSALFGGCSNKTSSSSVEGDDAALHLNTPVPTTPPDTTDTISDLDEDAMAVAYNDWTYYLDVDDNGVEAYSEDPPLHRRNADDSVDENLGIRGFNFDIISDFIYVDSNDVVLDESAIQTWSTTRMSLDGSETKKLEYGSMSARLIPEGEDKFYFTTLGDCAVYISDFSCENVDTLTLKLPDQSELDEKLGSDLLMQLDISSISDGDIHFDLTISADDGTILYSGSYKSTVDGSATENIEGTYYEYISQED